MVEPHICHLGKGFCHGDLFVLDVDCENMK